MSDPATNDPIIELVIRNDIFEVDQTSPSKVHRCFVRCTPCIAKLMANNPGYTHEVIHSNLSLAVCGKCGALTFTSAMRFLGVNAYQLNDLIVKRSIYTVTSRGISYRVRRVRFSV